MSLAASLSTLGWTQFSLNFLADESDDELTSWLAGLGYDASSLGELRGLISNAAACANRAMRQFACATEAELSHALIVKRDAIEGAASSRRELAAPLVAPGGTAAYQCWPSRVRRTLLKVKGDAALRQKLEDRERAKWAARLAHVSARLPVRLTSPVCWLTCAS